MSKKIPITTITPNPPDPQSDGYDLTGYYFKAEESGLNMYGPGNPNQPVKENITLGQSFPVQIPAHGNDPAITMNVTVNSYNLQVSGAWSDNPAIEGDPGSGTFQAQAGGSTADEEDIASSATA
jgi:hypothetical protein